MQSAKLKKLIEAGERDNIDYKLTCRAFCSKDKKYKAELAKDICAMANNGNTASYLLIGVSNDRKSFQDTSSLKLTDDNLQAFVKAAIFPPPRVTVTTAEREGHELTIIQVGPQAKQAFRIYRDFIDYNTQTCIRRNDVWIRRNATTDLATPEEIGALLGRRPPKESSPSVDNVQFERLPRNQKASAVFDVLEHLVSELGGQFHRKKEQSFLIAVPIGQVRFVWQISYFDYSPNNGYPFWNFLRQNWMYEHGHLVLSEPRSAKGLLQNVAHTHFRESWGWFSCFSNFRPDRFDVYRHSALDVVVPGDSPPLSYFVFHLHGAKDSDTLQSAFLNLVNFFETNDAYVEEVKAARDKLNAELRRWLQRGWGVEVSRHHIRKKPEELKLTKDEYYDSSSGRVLKTRKPKHLVALAKEVLAMSGDSA
jgi:hypothetical protein